MKNQMTTITSKAIKSMAGLLVLLLLSVNSYSQMMSCNAHFYHQNHFADVYFSGTFNPMGTAYAWDFGDGSTSSSMSGVHTYAAAGAYYVCLTVTRADSAGTVLCTATWCDSIHVMLPPPPPPPVCDAHFTHHHAGMTGAIDFDPAQQAPGTTYAWDYGDGSTSSVMDTTHAYAQPGTYYACLTVTRNDTAGNVLCTATWCDSVHVATVPPPPPLVCNAHFMHYRHNGSSVHFFGTHNPQGTTYAWDLGDGTTSATANFSHTYAQSGTYYVCLTVTNADTLGNILCTATWCDSVRIPPPPPLCNAHFSSWHRGHNLNVHFDSAHNPSNATYAWDFGDGSTSTAQDPAYAYALPGTYYACLTVTNTDSTGNVICTATWCDSVHVDTVHVCNHPHTCWRNGINGAANQGTAMVYPNPMTENAVLHIANTTGNVSFRVFESTGRLMVSKDNLTNGDFEISKKELGSGLYFYQVIDNNGNVLKGKLIVQ
ncbi:MAG: PKD domain-containing protein [Bacteroidetes bacterium]|nr:PKD domain-containing protein [Bacteroidota bacterium]